MEFQNGIMTHGHLIVMTNDFLSRQAADDVLSLKLLRNYLVLMVSSLLLLQAAGDVLSLKLGCVLACGRYVRARAAVRQLQVSFTTDCRSLLIFIVGLAKSHFPL